MSDMVPSFFDRGNFVFKPKNSSVKTDEVGFTTPWGRHGKQKPKEIFTIVL